MQDELVERCKAAVEATGLLDGDEARDAVRAIIPIVREAQRERDAALINDAAYFDLPGCNPDHAHIRRVLLPIIAAAIRKEPTDG